MKTHTWTISLHGKWGGSRTIEVKAATEAVARKRALEQALISESIGTVSKSS